MLVDISSKEATEREAEAFGRIFLKKDTIKKIKNKEIEKGDPLETAKIAGIYAVKNTSNIIPMCHQIPIDSVRIEFEINNDNIEARVTVKASAKTGVEMEALVGASVCLSTIWDMVKYLEKDKEGQYPKTKITDLKILRKRKGQQHK
jgi:cyclic pyranopterin phosphate synthase